MQVWYIRPNQEGEWQRGCPRTEHEEPLRVPVEAGDLIMINTALWYHRTEIPNTQAAADGVSFSYARDFHIGPREGEGVDSEVEMGNLDDTWATDDIAKGTVVAEGEVALSFPSAEHAAQSNCKLLQGAGRQPRVVAARNIREGESLRVAASEA